MKIPELINDLYGIMDESPLSIPLKVIDGNEILFGMIQDKHIIRHIADGRRIKRWALYNDHSELIIELEVEQ